jgi:hypothetical protein
MSHSGAFIVHRDERRNQYAPAQKRGATLRAGSRGEQFLDRPFRGGSWKTGVFSGEGRVYPSHMNEHTAPSETGGFFFEFRGKHPLRETAGWVSGVGLAGAGMAIAVIGTASHSHISMPLGIAVAVLGAILLVLYAVTRSTTKPASVSSVAGKHRVKNAGRAAAKESLAADLVVIANLYSQGALTAEEFAAAKRRLLGI